MKEKTEEHKQEDLGQELYNYGNKLLNKIKYISTVKKVDIHTKKNIIYPLVITLDLYNNNNYSINKCNSLMSAVINNLEPRIKSLENKLNLSREQKEIRLIRLQDKYGWWD